MDFAKANNPQGRPWSPTFREAYNRGEILPQFSIYSWSAVFRSGLTGSHGQHFCVTRPILYYVIPFLNAGICRKEYRCSTCGKVSKRAFNHQEHERTHSPPEQQCPYCPKKFKSLSSLAGHVARHKKEGSRVNQATQRMSGLERSYRGTSLGSEAEYDTRRNRTSHETTRGVGQPDGHYTQEHRLPPIDRNNYLSVVLAEPLPACPSGPGRPDLRPPANTIKSSVHPLPQLGPPPRKQGIVPGTALPKIRLHPEDWSDSEEVGARFPGSSKDPSLQY